MVGDHLARDPVETRDGSDDPLAEPRVLADLVDVRRGQHPALREGGARDADHADVVEPEAERDLGVFKQLGRRELGQLERQLRHSRAVGRGLAELAAPVVVQLECARKRLHRRRGGIRSGLRSRVH